MSVIEVELFIVFSYVCRRLVINLGLAAIVMSPRRCARSVLVASFLRLRRFRAQTTSNIYFKTSDFFFKKYPYVTFRASSYTCA